MPTDSDYMRQALRLAKKAYGATSPNPMVGAVLVKGEKTIGRGWHRRAGEPHAEIEALQDSKQRGYSTKGATLYVTLEPCSTHGRTPPCTDAILNSGIRRVTVGAIDPNPCHRGEGIKILRRAGLTVTSGVLAEECENLNEAFNHWIVHRTPFVLVKAAMTLDGKIATAYGESKWITGEEARSHAMHLRQGVDAVLVGINTVLLDNPSLTVRGQKSENRDGRTFGGSHSKRLRRIILDASGRTPLQSKVVTDEYAALTTIVVSEFAPKKRVRALAEHVHILVAPTANHFLASQSPKNDKALRQPVQMLDLRWLLKTLGADQVTKLLVEGGGEVNASFLLQGLAHRIAFFYAPKILGGHSRNVIAGEGSTRLRDALQLADLKWKKIGSDLFVTARVVRQKV